jgi:hypothetical protein
MCGTVSTSSQCATGTLASMTAPQRSAVTMTVRRFHRSPSAPASKPKTRYGAASSAATNAVRDAESLIR